MSNIPKYLSYKAAWERINHALEMGFYLEAITIQESIISDRLLSYVLGVTPEAKVSTKSGLGKLISHWRKHAGSSLIETNKSDLGQAVDVWRDRRNDSVHGLVKSTPRTATMQPEDFFEMTRQTAEEGKILARKVLNWHKKTLRDLKS
jgi:hypothetical protein